MGLYLKRFFNALRKAGYRFDYLWTKEFTKKGKLHIHAFITCFVPQGVIKHYWYLATDKTSYVVWIANAEVKSTAAYMAKYMSKDGFNGDFKKGERRYSMSRGFRDAWPELAAALKEGDEQVYEFYYKPDNTKPMQEAAAIIFMRRDYRRAAKKYSDEIFGERKQVVRSKKKPAHRAAHNRSNLK
jgi:hypothetical protein